MFLVNHLVLIDAPLVFIFSDPCPVFSGDALSESLLSILH